MKFVLCNSESINSYGFRTDVLGIDLSRFRKNPVMFYNHDPEKVIGRWENIAVEETADGLALLTAEPVFDTADPFAAGIVRKVNDGFLKGCSMGLMIKSITKSKGIDVATESLLLEASIVSLPADENALMLYADENREKTLSINDFNKLYYNMENNEITALKAQLAEKDGKIESLTATVDTLRRDLAERDYREAEAFADKAVSEGRLPENVKSIILSFYLSFPKETATLVGAIRPAEAQSQQVTLASMVKPAGTSAPADWDTLDRRPGALKKLKDENPEEFKRLYRAKFGCEWDRF